MKQLMWFVVLDGCIAQAGRVLLLVLVELPVFDGGVIGWKDGLRS